MVLPGDELKVTIKHVGMRDGNMAVNIKTENQRGEKVIEGTAEVAQPNTVYVFTGQGSQEPGMGMDLYNNSPAARAVWDAADAHLTAVYGFSIVEIVKNNPKEKTIHFGGIKGQAIRQRYMDMTYDTMDKDGNVKTLPLFGDINNRTQRYTFSHPAGLLYATQFAQIALVVTEKSAFEDMRAKGFVQKDSPFAGHSLGEYSALASVADVLPISSLVDVVFYRGITMQRAVERDSKNRSNYAMCAVNPSRISKTFNDAALREVVETITQRTGCLLEIVNFNVEVSCVRLKPLEPSLIHFSSVRVNNTFAPESWSPCKPSPMSSTTSKSRRLISLRHVPGFCRHYCVAQLDFIPADREVHCRASEGDAWRHHRLLLHQGQRVATK